MSKDLPEVGPWAREKLNGLRAYLSAYTRILSKHAPLKTVYVDAFTAAGRAVVRKRDHEDPTIHLGSRPLRIGGGGESCSSIRSACRCPGTP